MTAITTERLLRSLLKQFVCSLTAQTTKNTTISTVHSSDKIVLKLALVKSHGMAYVGGRCNCLVYNCMNQIFLLFQDGAFKTIFFVPWKIESFIILCLLLINNSADSTANWRPVQCQKWTRAMSYKVTGPPFVLVSGGDEVPRVLIHQHSLVLHRHAWVMSLSMVNNHIGHHIVCGCAPLLSVLPHTVHWSEMQGIHPN